MPPEDIPDLTSTTYTYFGLDDERAPQDTIEVANHGSICQTIKRTAFHYCESLVRITMPANVTMIEYQAFCCCGSLRFIRLSSSPEHLAPEAANVQDSEGMTPFQHLCRNDVTRTCLDDNNLSSLPDMVVTLDALIFRRLWHYC